MRILAALIAMVGLQGCNVAYMAHMPGPPSQGAAPDDPMEHCLKSLGFADTSQETLNAGSIAAHEELIAVWETRTTVASVRQLADRREVAFISRGSSHHADVLSKSFLECVSLHDPEGEVQRSSQRFLDTR